MDGTIGPIGQFSHTFRKDKLKHPIDRILIRNPDLKILKITGLTTLACRTSIGEINAHISLGNKTFGHFLYACVLQKKKRIVESGVFGKLLFGFCFLSLVDGGKSRSGGK